MKNILYKIPSWHSLKSLGNSKVIKSSYIWLFAVPLIAKLFSKINNVMTVNIFGAEWSINTNLPFSWEMFYYSALSFSIATLLYQIYCPYAIKKYDSFIDYKENGKGSDSLFRSMWTYCHCKRDHWPLIKKPLDRMKRFIRYFSDYEGELKGLKLGDGLPAKLVNCDIPDDKLKGAFFYAYDTWNATRLPQRLICSIFYTSGFIFFSIVIIENLLFVLNVDN